jgi:hypothetical protein
VLGCLCIFGNYAKAAETSASQPIVQLLYNANSDTAYLTSANGWGAPSCPKATYAEIVPSLTGRKQILAIALSAKTTGAIVTLHGTCNAGDLNYFAIHYITVH